MKLRLPVPLLQLFGVLTLCGTSFAGSFAIEFHTNAAYTADPFYNDVNSTIFYGTTVDGNQTGTLSARYYDSDPVDPGTNGLMNRGFPWNSEDPEHPIPGWLLRFGLESDGIGNPNHTYPIPTGGAGVQPASYLSFKMDSPDDVVFEEVSLIIKNIQGAGPGDKLWAGTSADNFSSGVLAVKGLDPQTGAQMSFVWPTLGFVGSGVEIRVYGFIGADEGTFDTGILTGKTNPPPLPEPTSVILIGVGLAGLVLRRRR